MSSSKTIYIVTNLSGYFDAMAAFKTRKAANDYIANVQYQERYELDEFGISEVDFYNE